MLSFFGAGAQPKKRLTPQKAISLIAAEKFVFVNFFSLLFNKSFHRIYFTTTFSDVNQFLLIQNKKSWQKNQAYFTHANWC